VISAIADVMAVVIWTWPQTGAGSHD